MEMATRKYLFVALEAIDVAVISEDDIHHHHEQPVNEGCRIFRLEVARLLVVECPREARRDHRVGRDRKPLADLDDVLAIDRVNVRYRMTSPPAQREWATWTPTSAA